MIHFPYELDTITLRSRTQETRVDLLLDGNNILTATLTPDTNGQITLTDLGSYISDRIEQARAASTTPNAFLPHTLTLLADDQTQQTYTLRPCRSRMRRKATELLPTMFLTMASGGTKYIPPTVGDESLYLLSDETTGAYTYTLTTYWYNTRTQQLKQTTHEEGGHATPGQVVRIDASPTSQTPPDTSGEWQLISYSYESAARRITYLITPDGLSQADITTLQFDNSFGLLEQFYILGQIQTDHKVTYNAANIQGAQQNYQITDNPTYKATIGPLTDGIIAQLRDLATSLHVTHDGRAITLTAVELKPTNAYSDTQTANITWREATEGGTTVPAIPLGTFDTTFDATFDRTT